MTGGYVGKILRLNLTNRSVSTMDTGQYEEYGGGHGFGSAIFWDICKDKAISAFDPGNVVTIMSGPLAGTLVPGAGRCEVQGLAPEAYPIEWFSRGSFGGRFAGMLKAAGWDGIVIEGRADSPVWVNIVNDQITFEDASGLWGLDTWETQEQIWRNVTGQDRISEWCQVGGAYTTQRPAVLCIGRAGENLSRMAVLLHDGGAAAGQGGVGGVFGAKNLKVISVIGTGSVKVADPQALMESWLWFRDKFHYDVDNPGHESPLPGWDWYSLVSHSPGFCVVNTVTEPSRPQGCMGCPLSCRRRTQSGIGNESICGALMFQSACGLNIPKEIRRAADLLELYGINAYAYGVGMIYLLTLWQMGIVGPGKEIETDLPFHKYGGPELPEALIKAIAHRQGIGDDLAEGLARAAERWGRYEQDTASGVLPLAYWGYFYHYDPRVDAEYSYGSVLGERDINEHCFVIWTHWLPYEWPQKGVEHFISAERTAEILSSKIVPYEGDPFMFDYSEGPTGIYSDKKVKTVSWHRHYTRFWKQSIQYCDFMWPNWINTNAPDMLGATPEGEPKFFNAVTGKNISFVDGLEIGRKVWNLDRAIWILQGRHRDMEVHTPWVYNVPNSINYPQLVYQDGEWKFSDCIGRVLDRERFEQWKTKYYEFEGWDTSSGWPKRSTLQELGLGHVADELESKGKLGAE